MFYSELMEKLGDYKNLQRNSMLAICKPREHNAYFLIELGRLWPTTKRQAEFMVKHGYCFDILGVADVVAIESILNKYGFNGSYKFTKGKNWIRLEPETQRVFLKLLKCEIKRGVYNA